MRIFFGIFICSVLATVIPAAQPAVARSVSALQGSVQFQGNLSKSLQSLQGGYGTPSTTVRGIAQPKSVTTVQPPAQPPPPPPCPGKNEKESPMPVLMSATVEGGRITYRPESGTLVTGIISAMSHTDRAYSLDQTYQFRFTGDYHTNARGAGEKYFRNKADNQWYFIKPDGAVYQFVTDLSCSVFLAKLDPRFHQEPLRLIRPVPVDWQQELTAYNLAVELRSSHGFKTPPGGYYYNVRKAGEIYLLDQQNRWWFVLPDGGLYLWNSATGEMKDATKIAQLTPVYNDRPDLLTISMPQMSEADWNLALAEGYDLDQKRGLQWGAESNPFRLSAIQRFCD